MVMGLVTVMGANLIETIYISLLGTDELAALGFTFPLVMLLQSMTMGLGVGASSVVARRIGADERVQATSIISHSLLITVIFVGIVSFLASLILSQIFDLLGAGKNIKSMALEFMEVWFYGLPFFAVAMVGTSLMRAAGDVATPGYLMALGSFLQVLFGPALIFGFSEWDGFGLKGAAIAFIVARTTTFLFVIYFLNKNKLLISSLDDFWLSTREVLHVGLPAIASNLIGPLSMTFITRLVAGYGSAAVAGFSLASRIETMLAMVVWAISMSVGPFVGQNWGARKFERVWKAVSLANIYAVSWGALSYVVLFLTSSLVINTVTDELAVADAALTYLLIVPIGMGLMGISANASNSFNALGRPVPPLVMSVVQTLVLTIPLAIVGNFFLGFPGIFVGGVFAMLISASVIHIWLRRTLRFGKSNLEENPEVTESMEVKL
ncbi:MAG: MATE family efflux transporter [Gammaproteobacteria bacterium]|nr:MATE family efflux transporter [Gammaproteobacteria bacterium]